MGERVVAEAFPPGEYLRDELEARGWTQEEFAEIIGRSEAAVNRIINAKASITPETARLFEAALSTSAMFWINLEAAYQFWLKGPAPARVAIAAKLRARWPVRDMVKRGWVEHSKDPDELEARVREFLGIDPPLDVLALGLFDLLAPLALKVAEVEGRVGDADRRLIADYFVKEWGYDSRFIGEGIKYTESKIVEFSVKDLAKTLVEFTGANPDCNFKMMSEEILVFLRGIVEVDTKVDKRKEAEIDKIEAVFKSANRFSPKKSLRSGLRSIRKTAHRVFSRKRN